MTDFSSMIKRRLKMNEKIKKALKKYIDNTLFTLKKEKRNLSTALKYIKHDYFNLNELRANMINDNYGSDVELDAVEFTLEDLNLLIDLIEIFVEEV